MKRVVIFSGAGLSAESGLPTFRDNDGLWENHSFEDLASSDGWKRDRELVLKFYEMRVNKLLTCSPNPAHIAISDLQKRCETLVITQNVDDLLERAGCQNVIHLHGKILEAKCENHFDTGVDYGGKNCDFKKTINNPIKLGDACPKCGSQLRPGVVWFGEAVDMASFHLENWLHKTDVFIGVGTSAVVYPAAGFLSMFSDAKQKYFIDLNPSPLIPKSFEVISGKAAEKLPELLPRL